MALLGTLATKSVMGMDSSGALVGESADKKTAIALAMEHFGVSEADLKKVLSAALEKGGDYADLFFEHTISNNIRLMDGAVNNSSSNIDYGVGVRVLSGDQTGYAYVENTTLEDMLKAARTAARIASANKGNKPLNLTEKVLRKNHYTVSSPWEGVSLKDKMPYLQKLNERIFSMDKRVRKVQASQSDATSHIFFCNSEGVMYYDYRPMVTLGAVCIMEENGKMENGYAARLIAKVTIS
ncbi:sugar kinase [Bacteroides pyogenes JCM 10003]|nr:sugar kinase [Bacteroides pyogenes JCM 10003]